MKGTKFFGLRIALVVCVLALLLAVKAGVSFALTAKPEPGAKYCITFEKAAKKAATDAIKARFGNVIREELKLVDVVSVVLPSASQAGELAKIPGVKRVVPDEIIIDFAGKPSEDELPWGVDRIDADMVWDKNGDMDVDPGANTGEGIRVAVLDTGIEKTHPDLEMNIKGGINTVGPGFPDDNWNDTHGHGTRIAGVIAAVDNDVGVIGIGPEIELYAVRFRETLYMIPQLGSTIDLCEGMEWCILGPDGQPGTGDEMQVINMSFSMWSVIDPHGDPQKDKPLHDPTFYSLVQQAYAAGIVQAAAVTNDSEWVDELHDPDNPPEDLSLYRFPASYPQVIGASATGLRTGGNPSQRGDYFTSFSNYGPVVDLAAPGVSIETTDIGGVYTTGGGGTSYAAPHVAGVAALIL